MTSAEILGVIDDGRASGDIARSRLLRGQTIKINSQPANLHNLWRTAAGVDLGARERERAGWRDIGGRIGGREGGEDVAIYGNWQERRTNFRKRPANTGPGVSRGEG